ncbi:DUF2909 domain-containing protein [Candidatus Nitrosacidococcus sp. I8]|uniref:DUF2909 domain-containing protein n=1 Tax=Candidatus Nitrosacidococcus sp. I8 TaxID=2942908 RepID=UPI002226EF90|nr:DUF2909 domain-containing protein [Candidatus Nitrosacidococcus sp. I8]CAH9019849.1 hypothetical protein NURINAE_01777 [Candidatus Nitrosacidococcus sp. I8]
MIFKLIIIGLLIFTVYSLGIALVALLGRSDKDAEKMLKALTWRISLSVGIFVLLMIGRAVGLITPHSAFQENNPSINSLDISDQK